MNKWQTTKDIAMIILTIIVFVIIVFLAGWHMKVCVERTGYPFCTIVVGQK